MATEVEDWNKMPQWMKDSIVQDVFVSNYVRIKYPEIYAEATEQDRFLQWQQKIAKERHAIS
jgi:hypothetical protein